MPELSQLPPELFYLIVDRLPPRSHYALALSSKAFLHSLQHLLAQHASYSPFYKYIDTKHSTDEGLANQAWDCLEGFLEQPKIAQYVEFMDLSERVETFDNAYEYLEPDEWSEPDVPSEAEPYDDGDIEVEGLLDTLDILDYALGCVDGSWETVALKADRARCAETDEDEISEVDGLPQEYKDDLYGLAVRAPKWYAAIKDDPWFQDIPRPPWPYSEEYLNPEGRPDTYVRGNSPLKQMIYNGGESPILAKLLVMASNLETLNICLRLSDYCLLMVLKEIVHVYERRTFRLKEPSPIKSLPLWRLKRVSMIHWSYWHLDILTLFARLPSVEEIRLNDHGNYPSATQRARFPLDTTVINKSGSSHGGAKTLIIQSLYHSIQMRHPDLMTRFVGLQAFYVRYSHDKNPFLSFVWDLTQANFDTLKYLWFAPINWGTDPVEELRVARAPKEIWVRPGRPGPPISEHDPFTVLHTLHCSWSGIVKADKKEIQLLVPSLRRLLIMHVPVEEEFIIIQCLDVLPNLEEFGAHAVCLQERYRTKAKFTSDMEKPAAQSIQASNGEQLPKLRQEIFRRGIKWLSYMEKRELELALTGS